MDSSKKKFNLKQKSGSSSINDYKQILLDKKRESLKISSVGSHANIILINPKAAITELNTKRGIVNSVP